MTPRESTRSSGSRAWNILGVYTEQTMKDVGSTATEAERKTWKDKEAFEINSGSSGSGCGSGKGGEKRPDIIKGNGYPKVVVLEYVGVTTLGAAHA